jgi:HEAT repeat protein
MSDDPTVDRSGTATDGGVAAMERLAVLPTLVPAARHATIVELVRDPSAAIRGEALRVGAVVLSDESVVGLLREPADATLRNAGLEILKMRGARAFSLAVRLLDDPDDDVALQAVLVLGHLKDPRALEPLRRLLRHLEPNVIQAAITAIGKIGDARVVEDLLPFVEGDLWLQFAAVEALGDLHAPAAVEPLAGLLADVMVGMQAAESLARIGGPDAWAALSRHWLALERELEAAPFLGLLAHVAEGLDRWPEELPELRPSLARYLEHDDEEARRAAARCLLVLGAGAEDPVALEVLGASSGEGLPLPTCLARRGDLVGGLLGAGGLCRSWGFLLAARFPGRVPLEPLVAAARDLDNLEMVAAVASALERRPRSEGTGAALDVYLALAPSLRGPLASLLSRRPTEVAAALAADPAVPEEARTVLEALCGTAPERIAAAIEGMAPARRLRVVSQLADRRGIVGRLPWSRWLEEDPALYTPAAAEAAVQAELRELLPLLRDRLAGAPSLELIRAVGDLGDRESVETLVHLLYDAGAYAPVVVESLGRIGGAPARQALRAVLARGDQGLSRIAYRALSHCAVEEDDAVFRAAIGHSDWYVRLSCAEVLGRFRRPENRAALAQLAADPVAIVSQRALSSLEA